MEHDGKTFSELKDTLPNGSTVYFAGTVPFPTIEDAIAAVKRLASKELDLWLDRFLKPGSKPSRRNRVNS